MVERGGACAAELERCPPPDKLGLRVTGGAGVDKAMNIPSRPHQPPPHRSAVKALYQPSSLIVLVS